MQNRWSLTVDVAPWLGLVAHVIDVVFFHVATEGRVVVDGHVDAL